MLSSIIYQLWRLATRINLLFSMYEMWRTKTSEGEGTMKQLITYDMEIQSLKTWDNGVRNIKYPKYWEWCKMAVGK
jgi:hypothetical protein